MKPCNQKLYLDFEKNDHIAYWYFGYMNLDHRFDFQRQYGYTAYSYNIKFELEEENIPCVNWKVTSKEYFKRVSGKKKK